MMLEQAGNHVTRECRHAMGCGFIDESVVAGRIRHAQIDMHAIAHSIGKWPSHERDIDVVLTCNLVSQLAEEKCCVGCGESFLVAQGHFHLRGRELAVDPFNLEIALFGRFGDGLERARRVRARTNPVHAMVGHWKFGERVTPAQQKELHLEAGHRREPASVPSVAHGRQCAPGIQGQRATIGKVQEGHRA